ncbi:MAG: hypothetical protein ACYCSN_06010 [Acidobacteriaceae bacterium]
MEKFFRRACTMRTAILRRLVFLLLAAAMLLARLALAQAAGAEAAVADAAARQQDVVCVADPQKAARAGLDGGAIPADVAAGEQTARSFASLRMTPDALRMTPDALRMTPDVRGMTPDERRLTPDARKMTAKRGTKAFGQDLTYRRQSLRFDASLGRAWAMVEVCGHPERPLRAVAVALPREAALAMHLRGAGFDDSADGRDGKTASGHAGSGAAYAGVGVVALMEPPVVRAGDTVRLWQSGGVVEMELAARAEQPGRAGDAIWLRSDAGGFTQRMRGVVRGRGSVEMLP